eukprot:9492660-Pyramimonas_sp.AAC.2
MNIPVARSIDQHALLSSLVLTGPSGGSASILILSSARLAVSYHPLDEKQEIHQDCGRTQEVVVIDVAGEL